VTQLATDIRPAYIRLDGQAIHAYNEPAFRYFLTLERNRARRSVRPLLLALVKLRTDAETEPDAVARTFATIFSALNTCVREVDFVGWYREGTVVGAVLASGGGTIANLRQNVSARVVAALMTRLSPIEAKRLRVRVVYVGATPRI